jgi:hypothetical protein
LWIPRARLSWKSRPPSLAARRAAAETAGVPCLLGCLAIAAPRLVLVLVWLGSDYLSVYRTKIWPFLGFLFMPLTTLAYAFAMHFGDMQWTPVGVAAVVTAVLVDVGLFKSSSRKRRVREITVRGERVD